MVPCSSTGFTIITSARLAPDSGYLGYFSIYAAGVDWTVDAPTFREHRVNWQQAQSLCDAMEGAHRRSLAWLEGQAGRP
jgi:hypothetical protein